MKEQEKKDIYQDWKNLVNMSAKEVEKFLKTPYGKKAGLSPSKAEKMGIRSGQSSARAIIRMKRRKRADWTRNDWQWAKAQVNFLKRTIPQGHPYCDKKGRPTRHLTSLMVWGHDPYKK